jgi:uncharacterized repeat protein (TIGR01451 family)
MKIKSKTLLHWLMVTLVFVLLASNLLAVAQAAPPVQDPRPPVDGGGGGGGSNGDGSGNRKDGESAVPGCTYVSGQVLNWGFGPQSDIGVELKTGSWQAAATSGSDGGYGLGGLGVGVATLKVAVPPGWSAQLKSLVQDAGVYLTCDYPVIANLAVYSGPQIDPPATITLSASAETLSPGDEVELTLVVKNTLPNDITNVIITNMLPTGLTGLDFTSSRQAKDIRLVDGGPDGQLAVAYFDKLPKNAKVTLRLTVQANEDLPASAQISSNATLFYRESAADQALVNFTTSSSSAVPIPAAIAGDAAKTEAEAEAAPASSAPVTAPEVSAEVAETLAESAALAAQPAAESQPVAASQEAADFVPPGNMPSTGGDLTEILVPTGQTARSEIVLAREVTLMAPPDPAPAQISPAAALTVNTEAARPAVSPSAFSWPITVALAVLFLGALVLGSGLKLIRRAADEE